MLVAIRTKSFLRRFSLFILDRGILSTIVQVSLFTGFVTGMLLSVPASKDNSLRLRRSQDAFPLVQKQTGPIRYVRGYILSLTGHHQPIT